MTALIVLGAAAALAYAAGVASAVVLIRRDLYRRFDFDQHARTACALTTDHIGQKDTTS